MKFASIVYDKAIQKNRQKELRSKLSQVLESEMVKLFDDFTETVSLIHGIECNKVIVYGLTLWREVQKRFDSSLPEGTFMQAYVFNELSDED